MARNGLVRDLAATGIRAEPLDRWREVLTPELADVVTEQTWGCTPRSASGRICEKP